MRLLLACVLLAAATLSGCADDDAPATTTTSSTPMGIVAQPEEVDIAVSAVGAFPVNPAFDPTDLQVPAGALVHVTFRNEDTVPTVGHNWVVEGIEGASSDVIEPGQETTFDFTAPTAAGEHAFYCSISGHRDAGMEGTLSVTIA